MLDAKSVFKQHYGSAPAHIVIAPGRLELLGNHTDYNEGLVMSLAIDKYIGMAGSPRPDGRIELVSSAFSNGDQFSADNPVKNPNATWADYIKGVLVQLRQRGIRFGGFNAAIHGTIPIGAGLSSSAALEVATALMVRQLYPYAVGSTAMAGPLKRDAQGELPPLGVQEKLVLARLCQAAENQFVGVNCGILDQVSSLFGKANHVILIDCRELSVQQTPLPGDVGVVVCDSGVKHALVAGEYNDRRRQCEEAARALGVKSLRCVEPKQLAAHRSKLGDSQYRCAYHVVGENQRVIFGERALRAGDFEQFGQYLYQSHESSRDFFRNSCPELDLLVELARGHRSCLGARLTGGGFGGATINLVKVAELEDFQRTIAAQFKGRTGRRMQPMSCRIVDGGQ
ncbi:MAG: galactokinase [Candidatus Omnitrophica bacterium]|nr:galactokinase [Candidatus Omnitrophota bacterium]